MGWQVEMGEDMHKVVVERQRHGSDRKSRKWGQRLPLIPDADYDDQPKFASSARRRQYGYSHKRLSDVLGPLRRLLCSNLGRPWDKVFSELRQGLDVRKVTGRHIFDHLVNGRNALPDRRGSQNLHGSLGSRARGRGILCKSTNRFVVFQGKAECASA
jgi:hypothetical protein